MQFIYDDGGRREAFFSGIVGDCACRSLAIAAQIPYKDAYALINYYANQERISRRKRKRSSARTGVFTATMQRVMASLGWKWIPTMSIGSGCKVHLVESELPKGRLIVRVSKHYTAVIDGVIHDTHNPSDRGCIGTSDGNGRMVWKDAERCVYGYWVKA